MYIKLIIIFINRYNIIILIKITINITIYGNNYRSFNVNPHDYTNNPINYQSHTTALNFAHRTKRN